MAGVESTGFQWFLALVAFVLIWIVSVTYRAKGTTTVRKTRRVEVVAGFVLVLLSGVTTSVYYLASNAFSFVFAEYQLSFVFAYSLVNFTLVIVFLRLLKCGFSSARLSVKNLSPSLDWGFGGALVALLPAIFLSPAVRQGLNNLSAPLVLVLLFRTFTEELQIRGFLQRRLEGWIGSIRSNLVSSVVYGMGHLPRFILGNGLTGWDAAFSVIALIPSSLVFGYIASKSDNLSGSVLCHFAFDLPLILISGSG
jgi:membrane protease YdiL (CAAX protease family)